MFKIGSFLNKNIYLNTFLMIVMFHQYYLNHDYHLEIYNSFMMYHWTLEDEYFNNKYYRNLIGKEDYRYHTGSNPRIEKTAYG